MAGWDRLNSWIGREWSQGRRSIFVRDFRYESETEEKINILLNLPVQ
jgi:hypothetical protein